MRPAPPETAATPWTVGTGSERRVCFDGLQIDPNTAVACVGRSLR